MRKNHKKPGLLANIPQGTGQKFKYLTSQLARTAGLTAESNNSTIFLSLRFLQHSFQCFSNWTKTEMNTFWGFNEKIHHATWQEVYNQSTKNTKDKTGFGYTPLKRELYPPSLFLEILILNSLFLNYG